MTHMDEVEDLRLLLDDFRRQSGTPAIGASIVEGSGQYMYYSVGVRRRSSSDEILLSDKWHIGSCTKSITAALWARLAELGYCGWEDRLVDIFDDVSAADADWKNISIRDALQCRAGLRPNFSRKILKSSWRDTRPLSVQRSDIIRRVLRRRPRNPGKFVYSNLSYVIIGAAIDRISGLSYEDALRRYVIIPLDIGTAGFGAPEDNCGHHSRVYLAGIGMVKGRPALPNNVKSDNPLVFSSAGSLHLSLEDWSKLIQIFLVDNSSNLLSEESLEMIFHPPAPFGPMTMGWMRWLGSKKISFLMQGSNTLWSATAALSKDRRRCVLVVCNDGRSRILNDSIPLAVRLLAL